MTALPIHLLHVGNGLELTLLEYLYRVLIHLLAIGGLAVLAFRVADAVGAIRSRAPIRFDRGGRDS